jgi:GTP-binding protein
MNIKNANLEATAVKPLQYPADKLPEVAFVGRSNVGKSAIINTLTRRKKLAYVGSTPGKTRVVNFYRVNDCVRLVDLPGYGYAKVSGAERKSWSGLAGGYLSDRENLKLIVFLVDIRHKPSALDVEMAEWIRTNGMPHVLCITKSDKLAKGRQKTAVSQVIKALKPSGDTPLVVFSSKSGEGREGLWEIISLFCGLGEENAE